MDGNANSAPIPVYGYSVAFRTAERIQAPVVLRLQLQIKGRQICRNVVQAQSLDNDLQAFPAISQFKITWFCVQPYRCATSASSG